MKRKKLFTKLISPIFLLGSLSYIYINTIAPNITWANNGADGGDLITAAATKGVAHPSGYPLYLLLAHFFQLLPVGYLAFRTNLLSMFFALLTALLVYAIVYKYLRSELNKMTASIAGLSAGFAIGLSPLFWSQALITEVYTLHAFFIALIIYITAFSFKKKLFYRWQGIIYGLAITNHITALLLVPIALVLNALNYHALTQKPFKLSKKTNLNWQSLDRQTHWVFISLLLYVLLPLRAIKNPIINWGNPVNLENFWWLVSGKIYRAYYLQDTLTPLTSKIARSASLLLEQFGFLGIVFGFLGLIFFYKISKLYVLTIWIALIFWLTSIIYQAVDSHLYLIPLFVSFSIWIGIAVGYSIKFLKKYNTILQPVFLSVLIITLGIRTTYNFEKVDASQDKRAENFAEEVFSIAPKNALVFAEGDKAIFSLWYFHFALEERLDLVILAPDLLHYDWYIASMQKAYPMLVLPTPFPWTSSVVATNPKRAKCYVKYDNEVEVSCKPP